MSTVLISRARGPASSTASPSRWLWQPRLTPHPRLRLFCFAYAGGGASLWRSWFDQVSEDVDLCPVQLPGREGRFAEEYTGEPEALLTAVHEALAPFLDRPFVLLGYSMGSLLAHALARRLRPTERQCLQRLVVAACSCPQQPPQIDPDRVDRAALLAYLRDLGGTPQAVFEHEELINLVLPMLTADFRLVARLREQAASGFPTATRLDCPIVALSAHDDHHADPDAVMGWADWTDRALKHVSVPGGHFALWQQPTLLQHAALLPDLAELSAKTE